MTWLQPPGHVHAMVHQTWLPGALAVRVDGSAVGLSVSAQVGEDRSKLRLLVVNNRSVAITTVVAIDGWRPGTSANVTTLDAPTLDAANPPGNPDLISPRSSMVTWHEGGAWTFPPLSVTTVVLTQRSSATPC